MYTKERYVKHVQNAYLKWQESHSRKDYVAYARSCAIYLSSSVFPPNEHWFCGDETTCKYATSSLFLFATDVNQAPTNAEDEEAQERFREYEKRFSAMLASCSKCSAKYQSLIESFIVNELVGAAKFSRDNVKVLLNMLLRKDKQRLTAQLQQRPLAPGMLTEIFWNEKILPICVPMIAKSPELVEAMKALDANPGLLYMYFSQHSIIRDIAKTVMFKDGVVVKGDYLTVWSSYVHPLFNRMLRMGLASNVQATAWMDMGWESLSQLVLGCRSEASVVKHIINIAFEEILSPRFLPCIGVHAFLGDALRQESYLRSKNTKTVSLTTIEAVLNAITNVEPSSTSQSMNPTSGAFIHKWFRHYLKLKPQVANIVKRVQWAISVPPESFPDHHSYEEFLQDVVIAMTENPREVGQPVIRSSDAQLMRVPMGPAVATLWAYQFKHYAHQDKESFQFWEEFITQGRFGTALLSAESLPSLVGQFFRATREVPFSVCNDSSDGKPEPPATDRERLLQCFLEALSDIEDSKRIQQVLWNDDAIEILLLCCISPSRYLSQPAEFLIHSAFATSSLSDAVTAIVQHKPEHLISSLNTLLLEAQKTSTSWLPLIPGLLRITIIVLDQIYSIRKGVDAAGNPALLRLLFQFWYHCWTTVSNVLANIRNWGRNYKVKPLLTASLECAQSLLSKFRLLDVDLSTGLPSEEQWGSKLAQPVIDCVESMGGMLKLNITELLAQALAIMIEILGIMESFKVVVPKTLRYLLQTIATRERKTVLKDGQIRELLLAAGINDEEIVFLIEKKPRIEADPIPASSSTSTSATISKLSQKPTSSVHSSLNSPTSTTHYPHLGSRQQSSIGDFFKSSAPSSSLASSFSNRPIVNNRVVPQSAPQSTAIEAIRSQLGMQEKNQRVMSRAVPGSSSSNIGVIHPPRPPGYNPRKTTAPAPAPQITEVVELSSDDDDERDQNGVLQTLGARPAAVSTEVSARLREAYSKNKTRMVGMIDFDSHNALQRAKLDKEREERLMKLRMAVTATELHREVLSWDYFAKSHPVTSQVHVPNKFDSVKHYQEVMAPLVFLETWEQIQNSRTSKPSVLELTFGKRVKVDGFVDVYVSAPKAAFQEIGISEGAILLLCYDPLRPNVLVQPSQDVPHVYARVKDATIKPTSGNTSSNQYYDFQIRMLENVGFLNNVNTGATMSSILAGNVRPIEREFTSLMALPYYDLLDQIVEARPTVANDDVVNISNIQAQLQLNYTQATAVSRSLTNKGFTLIQGPPGTGKTKTIVGMVGAYFTDKNPAATPLGMSINNTHNQPVSENKRLLICAPSNAAVDEIVFRLNQQIGGLDGKMHKFNIVRLGRLDIIAENVHDVTLDSLVTKVMRNTAEKVDESLRSEHTALVSKRNEVRKLLGAINYDEDDEETVLKKKTLTTDEIRDLEKKHRELSAEIRKMNYALDSQRTRIETARKQRDQKFRQQQNEVVQNAQIVCTTLSGAAHGLLTGLSITFDTVIIDEAAQSVEMAALIPLRYGCKQCIMVGDPNQLPPTVISQEATRLKYNQSLFVRMFKQWKTTPGAICMLDTQFRMHPEISKFPSLEFYKGELKDAIGLAETLRRPWHMKYPALGPYTFFEVQGKHERHGGRSLRNTEEAKAALSLVQFLRFKFPDSKSSIGIISPYKEQVRHLKQIIQQAEGIGITSTIDFNSIDGFQGQEKDIIILSCVRASDGASNNIGFLGDLRRLNVAITRAKASLWIIGDPSSLAVDPIWRRLIADAHERGLLCKTHGQIKKAVQRFGIGLPAVPLEMPDLRSSTDSKLSDKRTRKYQQRQVEDEEMDLPPAKRKSSSEEPPQKHSV